MRNLFLTCPDCYIEQAIQKEFGDDSMFISALGTVFDMTEFEHAEEVNMLLLNQGTKHIYIVNDFGCTFIQNAAHGSSKFNTLAEKTLLQIAENNQKTFQQLNSITDKAIKLATWNIYRQAYNLLDAPFLGSKIEDGDVVLKGLIYNREQRTFQTIPIPL